MWRDMHRGARGGPRPRMCECTALPGDVDVRVRAPQSRSAARPADEEHAYGHEKADYLSAGVEGSLILVAAGTIAYVAIGRLANPQPLDHVGIGVVVSIVASAINLAVARILINVGREEQ